LAQIQAFPLAASGTYSITVGVKTASMHQQRSGFVPDALAFSMAQTLGSPQMGQRVGSMLVMKTLYLEGMALAGKMAHVVVACAYNFPSGPTIFASEVPICLPT
jgi:hypothetical protein